MPLGSLVGAPWNPLEDCLGPPQNSWAPLGGVWAGRNDWIRIRIEVEATWDRLGAVVSPPRVALESPRASLERFLEAHWPSLGTSWRLLGQSGASKKSRNFLKISKFVLIGALGLLLSVPWAIWGWLLHPPRVDFGLRGMIWWQNLGKFHANSWQKPWQTFWATQTHENQLGCGGFASSPSTIKQSIN